MSSHAQEHRARQQQAAAEAVHAAAEAVPPDPPASSGRTSSSVRAPPWLRKPHLVPSSATTGDVHGSGVGLAQAPAPADTNVEEVAAMRRSKKCTKTQQEEALQVQGMVALAPINDAVHAVHALGPKFEQWLGTFPEPQHLQVLNDHCTKLLKQLPPHLQQVVLSQSAELQVSSIVRLLGTE